ncbi:MAG TPA: hypothetical protein VHT68_07810 [Pseudolabrys sp.]|nr:hypothetical protein [Pseudolabrys sp.]
MSVMQTVRLFSDNEITKLKAMARDGYTATEIGRSLKRSRSSVCSKAAKLGIKIAVGKLSEHTNRFVGLGI